MGSLGPKIAKKIRHLLAKNNLSQAEFSRLTDIVGPQLSKYLTGKNTPVPPLRGNRSYFLTLIWSR